MELTDLPDPVINSLGCRGVGEIGIAITAAVIANAVYHATGVRVRDLPITPDKLPPSPDGAQSMRGPGSSRTAGEPGAGV